MNANNLKTHIFHKIKYDLKLKVMEGPSRKMLSDSSHLSTNFVKNHINTNIFHKMNQDFKGNIS